MKKRVTLLLILILLYIPIVLAHEEETNTFSRHESIKKLSYQTILIGAVIITLAVLISLKWEKNNQKKILFIIILITSIIITIILIYLTLQTNLLSETKGPVHWHADFEIYECGKKINLKETQGLSNRIGNSLLHEHGDSRIHVEGVLLNKSDVSLKNFFKTIGGKLTLDNLEIPTNNGKLKIENGETCNNKKAELQMFVYSAKEKYYKQNKIKNFPDYIIAEESNIPPGNCIIIEFDENKKSTKNICETYKIAIEKGDLIGS